MATRKSQEIARTHQQGNTRHMSEGEIKLLYDNVASALVRLFNQSEADGDIAETNRARVYFLALSNYLAQAGVLQALTGYANWSAERMERGEPTPTKRRKKAA